MRISLKMTINRLWLRKRIYRFYIDGNFAFSGCKLSEAEIDGDFLVYQKERCDVLENFRRLKEIIAIPYESIRGGKIVYRKSTETFIFHYYKIIEDKFSRITRNYEGFNLKFECEL